MVSAKVSPSAAMVHRSFRVFLCSVWALLAFLGTKMVFMGIRVVAAIPKVASISPAASGKVG